MGWEETVLTSTAHLIRTCLTKKEKPVAASSQTNVEPVESVEKLKRQIQVIFDRTKSGGVIELI